MKTNKHLATAIRWLLAVFVATGTVIYFPEPAAFLFIPIAIFIAPIPAIDKFIAQTLGLKKSFKVLLLLTLFFFSVGLLPRDEKDIVTPTVPDTTAPGITAVDTPNFSYEKFVVEESPDGEGAVTATKTFADTEEPDIVPADAPTPEIEPNTDTDIEPVIVPDETTADHQPSESIETEPGDDSTPAGDETVSERVIPNSENYHGHVYATPSGKRYHYEALCGKNSKANNMREITWDEVDRRGLTPCGTCVLK